MRRVWLRAGLVIVMLGVAVASGYQVFLTKQHIEDEREAERAFTALGWKLAVSLSDLRAAQQAYVAAGQDRGYWVAKTADQIGAITTSLSSLARLSTAPGTSSALAEATSAVDDLQRMDARARDHSSAGQDLMASDLIFTDGLELSRSAASHVELARAAERAARDASAEADRRTQGIALAAAMGTGVLVALLLLPVARPQERAGVSSETPADIESADTDAAAPQLPDGRVLLDLDLESDRLSLADEPDTSLARAEPGAALDLRAAAELCTDLGRLSGTADLPDLLGRAAAVLNASGLIVWVRDGSGDGLRPAIGHGYAAQSLAALGTIACDGDNATAAAFRDVRMHVVAADLSGTGAVVAPLITSTSCVGVLSVELREGWETSDAVQSAAAILAAQLATLVVADPVTHEERAQA